MARKGNEVNLPPCLANRGFHCSKNVPATAVTPRFIISLLVIITAALIG